MKLEKQVCNLELAKRLKELGVKQDSVYNWLVASDGARLMNNPVLDTYRYFEQCSAFTVAELGEMLPAKIKKDGNTLGLEIVINAYDEWVVSYWLQFKDAVYGIDKNEADARAKMLIYLIENNLINPRE